ncbi:MAG TPA: CHAT domain-containing protein [Thermoanaerobaculia bacterium]|nr:CHAT domain-containing protein [Thermoanaerobaculia bacterium]
MRNTFDFVSLPPNLKAVRKTVLHVLSDLAPEEVEVTEAYVSPLIELAGQDKLPPTDSRDEPGAFGAADWMLPSIVFLVMGVLQTRLMGGIGREAWETITEGEVRDWVRRSGWRRGRKLIPELTRSLQRAFREHLAGFFRSAERTGAREERQTDISCPRQVWKGTARFSLVVRLTVGPAPLSAAKGSLEVEPGKTVLVHLQAPTAFEILNAPRQEITIPPGQDSQPAVFDLHPRETGPQSIGLDFYQAGNHLGTVSVLVDVVDQPIPETQAYQTRLAVLTLDSEVPAPDRVLRISSHPQDSSLVLTLIQNGGTSWRDVPAWRIRRDPAAWAEELFKELNDLTSLSDRSDRELDDRGSLKAPEVQEALKALGQNLWRELPEELRSLYSQERDRWRNGSLLILSDEPHLPWELLWPYGEGWEDDEPWCLTLRLSRWLARGVRGDGNSGAPGILPLTAVAYVAPGDSHLPAAQKERISLQYLLGQRGVRDVSPPVPTWGAVMDVLRAGPYDWFHAATHGKFSTDAPDQRSVLLLEGSQTLTPQHFVGAKIEDGLRRNRPAFVFNICHAGRMGWGLTGLGGWADRLISCGAGLFLGPLWRVTDETAAQMAHSFYKFLLDGETTVGEAVRRARREARKAGNPTWLAYSLYAHPNARVHFPGETNTAP